ncbi:oligosaccharide flippase family protein [Moellerella wisconsensis]|uniref:lipopolysaccharide biosynthesis protein n=1 Tax=Moellerella wisconsensis TaxID=158849 RepID=UPI0030767AA0
MKKNKQKNTQSIFKNIYTLFIGNSIGKLIGLISIPIIAKIYTPAEIGLLSLFTSATNLLFVFSTLKICLAIPLEQKKNNAISLVYICFIINIVISLILLGLGFFYHLDVMNALSIDGLIPYWYYIIISSLLIGFYETLENWNVQQRKFTVISKTKISQSILGNSTKIIFGLLSFKLIGLLFGQIISQSGGIIPLSKGIKIHPNIILISIKKRFYLIKKHIEFPLYRLPSQLLLSISLYIPIFFFNYEYGESITGQLSMAFMSLAIPISLIGNSISQVYYSEIAKITAKEPGEIHQLTNKIIKKLFLLSIPPTLVLFFYGEFLFTLVFGLKWQIAGKLIEILSVSILFQFISSPLINAFTIFKKQKEFVIINLLRTIMLLISFLIAHIYQLDYIKCTLLYTLIISINYIYTIIRIYFVIKKERKCHITTH